jgi:hypothetical protein
VFVNLESIIKIRQSVILKTVTVRRVGWRKKAKVRIMGVIYSEDGEKTIYQRGFCLG